jgi:hypothetical protein
MAHVAMLSTASLYSGTMFTGSAAFRWKKIAFSRPMDDITALDRTSIIWHITGKLRPGKN